MRIAHLVDNLGFGGLQQVVARLAICLKQQGHSVHLICLRSIEDGVPAAELQQSGLELLELHKPEGFQVSTLFRLKRYLVDHKIEVLNAHNHLVNHYAVAAGRGAGVRAIVNTLHGTATLDMPGFAKVLFWASCLGTDRIICVSEDVREVFGRRFRQPQERLCVILNGIDLTPFLAVQRKQLQQPPRFGAVARLVAVKDFPTLLRAFAAVRQHYPGVKLRLLGGGPDLKDLQSLAGELGVAEAVDFCGFSHDVAGFLAQIDIYVISSLSEGLPISLLEATAAGLPVVSTAVGGVPAVIKRTGNGRLCPPADVKALAETLEAAIKDPQPEATRQGRDAVRTWYSIERMAADYLELYRKLLS